MFIIHKGTGQFPELTEDGSVLTIAGVEYDLTELQEDSEKSIDIKSGKNYLANIIIPPAEYSEPEIEDEERVKQPVNMAKVKTLLWGME